MARDEDGTADKECQLEEQEFLRRWEANPTPLQVYFRDARTYSRDRVAADRNCPSEGYDWFQINGKWFPEAPGDELPKNTIFPALHHILLRQGICTATGRHRSANAKPVIIEAYAWDFLELAGTKLLTLVATNRHEIFFDIRFFPSNHPTIKAMRAEPYVRETLQGYGVQAQVIRIALNEYTSRHPAHANLPRPGSLLPFSNWVNRIAAHAQTILDAANRDVQLRPRYVERKLSDYNAHDLVQDYLNASTLLRQTGTNQT